jgi:hypothetical protein
VIDLHDTDDCSVEFDINDWIEFDFIDIFGRTTHWKIEVFKIYFNKKWLIAGIDLESGDELTFMMKYMENVEHY